MKSNNIKSISELIQKEFIKVEKLIATLGLPVDPKIVIIIITIIVGLLIVFAVTRLFKKKTGNTILLAGLCDAGKTALFFRLRDGDLYSTHTSIKENEGVFMLRSEKPADYKKYKPVHIVDLPGHHRVRGRIQNFIQSVAGILFVIDAVSFPSQVREIAEYLYQLFTDTRIHKKRTPFLIVLNKSELINATTEINTKDELEKELNKLRSTKRGVGGDKEEKNYINRN